VEDVDLLCAPDVAAHRAGVPRDPGDVLRDQIAVRDHCMPPRLRFAILDSPAGATPQTVLEARRALGSPNAALYYPWIDLVGGRRVPPCGHVAGIYARADARAGPHDPPANELLEGVVDLERDLSDADQAGLDPAGVNCLRALPGRGIRVYGARTLSVEPAWTFVSVRRVAIAFERRAQRDLQPFVFEPNGPELWSQVRRELDARCQELWRQGALAGDAPEQAYFVHCDAETNTAADRDAGRLVAVVGLAVVSPAQFVIVRIVGEGARR
jgi:phage tail sheath protein FI